jgi:hypothetical protein
VREASPNLERARTKGTVPGLRELASIDGVFSVIAL